MQSSKKLSDESKAFFKSEAAGCQLLTDILCAPFDCLRDERKQRQGKRAEFVYSGGQLSQLSLLSVSKEGHDGGAARPGRKGSGYRGEGFKE